LDLIVAIPSEVYRVDSNALLLSLPDLVLDLLGLSMILRFARLVVSHPPLGGL
jgi:hypothetical protein